MKGKTPRQKARKKRDDDHKNGKRCMYCGNNESPRFCESIEEAAWCDGRGGINK